jgi:hypothetical protein
MGRRLFELPERRPGPTVLLIGLLFAAAYSASLVLLPKPGGRIVVGDALHYYVYVRSIVFDRDLQFGNDYDGLATGLVKVDEGNEWRVQPTATGHVRNLMSIGPAIAWMPLFLIVAAGAALASALGLVPPASGFERVFQASAAYSGIAAAAAGAYLAYRLCERLDGRRVAAWATLSMWLGSQALYYSLVSPTYSHAVSMLASSAFFLGWAATRDRQTPARYALVGLLGGLTTLVRWQDAVFFVVPAIDAWWHFLGRRPRDAAGFAARLAVCAAGGLVGFLPQIGAWIVLYGSPFAIPQGPEFMRWTSPQILPVLVSDNHGLLTWTPIVAVALAGLALSWRRDPLLGAAAIAAFVLALYTNAVVADWWAGEAYGARRFLSCFPIFVLGLGASLRALERRPGWLRGIALAVIALNGLLLLQYQLFMRGLHPETPYPHGWYALLLARFAAPIQLFEVLAGR